MVFMLAVEQNSSSDGLLLHTSSPASLVFPLLSG